MNRKILAFIFFAILGCSEEQSPDQPDNLPSNAIQIGDQIWMKKNLDVDTFRNGDEIFHAKNQNDWNTAYNAKIPAWSYYEDLEENGEIYGKMYNYYAVTDPRGLAPQDWRIPKIEDWNKLFEFNGGIDNAGIKLKSNSYWSNVPGTNESGFGALPGGQRYLAGYFDDLGRIASFWTFSFDLSGFIISVGIVDENSRVYVSSTDTNDFGTFSYMPGFSVRCIKE
jgi:uncharacterized protein (TIGR02145 family)